MIYTIRKNCHYSLPPYPLMVCSNEINKKVVISKEAWFEKTNTDDEDINKLFGVAFGILGVHKNSFRIGWKPDFNIAGKILLYAYYYNNDNQHISQLIGSVYVEEQFNIRILWNDNNYFSIKLNNYIVFNKELQIKQSYIKFYLRPYHGGNNKSRYKYNVTLIRNKYV